MANTRRNNAEQRGARNARNAVGTQASVTRVEKSRTGNTGQNDHNLREAFQKVLNNGGEISYNSDNPTDTGEGMNGVELTGQGDQGQSARRDSGVAGVSEEEDKHGSRDAAESVHPTKIGTESVQPIHSIKSEFDDEDDVLCCTMSLITKTMSKMTLERDGTIEGYVKSYRGWYKIVRVGVKKNYDFDMVKIRGEPPEAGVLLDKTSITEDENKMNDKGRMIRALQGVACSRGVKGIIPCVNKKGKPTLKRCATRIKVKWASANEKETDYVSWEKISTVRDHWKNQVFLDVDEDSLKYSVPENVIIDRQTLLKKGDILPNFEGAVFYTAWRTFRRCKESMETPNRQLSPTPDFGQDPKTESMFLKAGHEEAEEK